MTKNSEQERQELVAAIEGNRYAKSNKKNTSSITAVVVLAMFMMIVMSLFSMIKKSGGSEAAFAILIMLGMFFGFIGIIVLAVALASKSRGMKLNSLTSQQRWLILNGEKIEAHVESIDRSGNLRTITCTANYQGQNMRFVSPAFDVEPIPFEERKIDVFVNPQAPNQYFVNVFSHLPFVGENRLNDRSEMKCESPANATKLAANNSAAVVIVAVIMIPMALFLIVAGFFAAAAGGGFVALLMILGMPALFIYAIAKVAESARTVKAVLAKGYYIEAKGERFWVTSSKNSKTYHLTSRYIEPGTKQMHEFHTTGPSSMRNLVGTRVRVYINPDDLTQFYCDTKTSLAELGFTTSKYTSKQ